MFCERCGTQLPDTAEFCTNCGTSIARGGRRPTAEKIPDTQIQLRVQPTFKFAYMVLPSAIVFGILILFFSLMIGMINAGVGLAVFLVSTLIMVIILGIKTALNKKQYDSFCYDFYKTKVIYRDSFLNLSEKEVKYKYIREVTMSQNILERFCGIGTIKIFTNASSGGYSGRNHSSMKGRNGLYIHCVDNVQEQYRIIKEIIDEGTPDEY